MKLYRVSGVNTSSGEGVDEEHGEDAGYEGVGGRFLEAVGVGFGYHLVGNYA